MEFQFDQWKSASNLKKHGIDFQTAQQLWNDPNLFEIDAKTAAEPRWMVIGEIEGKHWFAIVTYRDNTIRLISVRPSHKKEVLKYEENNSRRV